jgi:hypothetical protein
MAKAQGVSKSTVSNICRSHQVKPHRVKRFKLSSDPQFMEKPPDVVSPYLNPSQQSLVICWDEKSQIQALPLNGGGARLGRSPTHSWPRQPGRPGSRSRE